MVETLDALWPLSFGQERLLYFDRLHPNSALYSVPYRLDMTGALDAAKFRRSLEQLVGRHEILRTCFVESDGNFYQKVLPAAAIPLPVEDLSAVPDPEARADAIEREFASLPYRLLNSGSLLRVRLLGLGPRRHRLLFALHHVVFDGWSMAILLRELDALYQAALGDRPPAVVELPVQYADYARWQREGHAAGAFDADLAYWRRRLDGARALLPLPTDRPRPAVPTYAGRTLRIKVAVDLCAGLLALARDLGVTPFVVLTTTVSLLLSRTSGQPDVCVGIPVAGRDHPDLACLIGYFANLVVLRTRPAGCTFRQLVESTHAAFIEAIEHGGLPFDRLVEAVRPQRSVAYHPLFQVCVTHQTAEDSVPIGGLRVVCRESRPDVCKFDMTFCFEQDARGMDLLLEYSAVLFDEARIARLGEHFAVLARHAATAPDTPVDRLPVMSAAEREQVLRWGRGPAPRLAHGPIATQFEACVRRGPDRVAVKGLGVRLTYADVDARASRLARFLICRGCRPGTRVGLVTEGGVDMVVGMLGIIKASAAYVPLDPRHPMQRLAFMVRDSGASFVLGTAAQLSGLSGLVSDASLMAIDWAVIGHDRPGGDDATAPARLARDDLLAYVMYTSGSSGNPKGVAIEHRAVTRLVRDTDYLPFADSLTFAQISNVSFDPATLEIWGALLNGGTLALLGPNVIPDPRQLAEYFAENRVTTVIMTVALFGQLARTAPTIFRGVRQLLIGGDRADAEAFRRLRQVGYDGVLINGYGPTEATTLATTHCVTAADLAAEGPVPIGRPIANTEVYVVTPAMDLAPIGVVGELCIGGCGIAQGYLARPGLTADVFVPNPFSAAPGDRLYRTGDLCAWREDGTLGFIGREDGQVKVNGFRVELGDIRAALASHPRVADAAVNVEANEDGKKYLVAYAVPQAGPDRPAALDLKSFLRSKLPEYMIPAAVALVDRFPMTPNWKIDFSALRSQTERKSAADAAYATACSPLAARLFPLVARVLGVAAVKADEGFFEMGGTSLDAVRLSVAISDEFDRHLSIADILQAETMGRLEAVVAGSQTHSIEEAVRDAAANVEVAEPATEAAVTPPRAVLLTGASGFMGVFLLAELTRRVEVVYCLQRAEDQAQGLAAIERQARAAGLELDARRIRVVPGDLAAPGLGMADADRARLAGEVDAVLHCGAFVHHLHGYRTMKPANIGGTVELLRFALDRLRKPFCFVSTLSVATSLTSMAKAAEAVVSDTPSVDNGYLLTKWVAEHLVAKCAERYGLPAVITRAGNITGASGTGYSNYARNHFWLFHRGCLQLGAFPDLSARVEMMPVDVVARAIVALALAPREGLLVANLCNPSYLSQRDFFARLGETGREAVPEEPRVWQRRLANLPEGNALAQIKDFYTGDLTGQEPAVEQAATLAALTKVGVAFEADYDVLVPTYVRYLRREKFLP